MHPLAHRRWSPWRGRPMTFFRCLAVLIAVAAASIPVASASAAGLVSVQLGGNGTGKITGGSPSMPSTITCSNIAGEEASECSHEYGLLASVSLAAQPASGIHFKGWLNNGAAFCEEPDGTPKNPCSFSTGLAGAHALTAEFVEVSPPPTVAIEPPTEVGSRQATFKGSVDPNGVEATWRFEYRAEGAPTWSKAPVPDGVLSAGGQAEPVAVTVQGLSPDTNYEVQLSAANSEGSELSSIEHFRTEGERPSVLAEVASSVSESAATLVARLDPQNAPIQACRFELGPEAGVFGRSIPCSPASAGESPAQVSARVTGLSPSTTYYFRVVAGNDCAVGCGATESRAVQFETYPMPEAPPSRGYELVSAADTNGVAAFPDVAAASGERYAYVTKIPVPGSKNGNTNALFVASRGGSGSWSQVFIGPEPPPAGSRINGTQAEFFSKELDQAVFATGQEFVYPDDANNESLDVYLQRVGQPSLTWVSGDPSIVGPQTESGDAAPSFISEDGRRVLFESRRHLLPADQGALSTTSLYEWKSGTLSLVGQIPENGGTCETGGSSPCVGSPSGSILGSGSCGRCTTNGASTSDGSRVAFESGAANPRIYVRIDGRRTVEATASAPGAPPIAGPLSVVYWGAGEGLTSIFYTSSSPLTGSSGAPNVSGGNADLYRYDIATSELRDLAPSPGGAGIKRVYGIYDGGRRVYFTSTRQLNERGELTDAATTGEGLYGTAGEANLYLAEVAGGTVRLTFITTIDAEEDEGGQNTGGMNLPNAWREMAANSSGSLIAFRDRLPAVAGRATGNRPQVFVYDADRRTLACVSCPGDGGTPPTAANLAPAESSDGIEPSSLAMGNTTTNPAGPHVANISSGGAVFFQTASPLVADDINGKIDVYEYNGGQVSLITSGTGQSPSSFAGASEDGSSVFFRSASGLVQSAQAELAHIYVARVGGGVVPPAAPSPCTGDDCRGQAAQALPSASAASRAFIGEGNASHGQRRKSHRKRRKAHVHQRKRHGAKAHHHGGRLAVHRKRAKEGRQQHQERVSGSKVGGAGVDET